MLISGAVLVLMGIALGIGGGRLIALGGSWYYALAAAGFIAAGCLLAVRSAAALWIYAAVVLGTLAWSLWEVGLDWWPLAARGDVIFLAGLYLLAPWTVRGLKRGHAQPRAVLAGVGALAGSLAACAVAGVIAMFTDLHDQPGTLSQAGDGASTPPGVSTPDGDWRAYSGTWYGERYSPLAQITPANVARLKVAWTYHTGDIRRPTDPLETTYEVTPLKVGGLLYLCTPHDRVIALDAETGQERWRFDPGLRQHKDLQHLTCRGVSYYEAPPDRRDAAGDCPRRLFMPTADARLIALNADNGTPCSRFGNAGTVELWRNMPQAHSGMYYSTSPPVVARGRVIIGGAVTDNYSTHEPSGVIRAYDALDGKLLWNWDSGNPDRTEPLPPDATYTRNSPNSWSIASADEALGLVYLPMGNQTPDQWGGNRSPDVERFASSITALDIETGRVRWVFQTVHHDLWDMDVGAQPSLIDLRRPEGVVPALIAPTKTGNLFVLDRRTGKPIFPVAEKPVPQGAAAGDHTAATQPFSALSFLPAEPVREAQMWGATMFDQLACRIRFRALRYDGPFTPPSTQGSLVFPGNFGVFDWGGIAVDPVRQIAFATPSYMAFVDRLVPRAAAGRTGSVQHPAGGSDVQGSSEGGANPNWGAPFSVELTAFLSPLGLPCQAPPWGYVAGIDLRTGAVAYRHKNGTIRDSSPIPLPFKLGVPSLGGPVITAGGVVFLTSTLDYYVRAYDVATGRQLWQARLPAGGQATPMTYRSDRSGRQFVIAVAGGHGSLGTRAGDTVVAYTLPRQ
jgi:quinoprotein glucose dehydrogenase